MFDTGHWLPNLQILSINQTGLPQNLSPQQNMSLDLGLVGTIAELNLGPKISFFQIPLVHSKYIISNAMKKKDSLNHPKMLELFQKWNIIGNFKSECAGTTTRNCKLQLPLTIQLVIINFHLTHPKQSEKSKN